MLTIEQVSLPLLLRQKKALLRAIDRAPEETNRADAELLVGILNLLDYIHDTIDPPLPWNALEG